MAKSIVESNGAVHYSYATTYYDVVPYPADKEQGRLWRDGMIGGNGRFGFVTSGSPYNDTIIYQDVDFIMPSARDRYDMPDLTNELEITRQAIINLDDSWRVSGCGEWNYGYAFHPGQVLRLRSDALDFEDYARWTNYDTGEVAVSYTDANGTWIRKTFTSRVDDATITSIQKSSDGNKINMILSLDNVSGMYKFAKGDEKNMRYKKLVSDDCSAITFVAHYPDYRLSSLYKGGYAGVTYVIVVGGSKEKVQLASDGVDNIIIGDANPAIKISDADAVYLITKVDRTFDMGDFDDFADASRYDLTDLLLADCIAIAGKYSDNGFSYDMALAPSAKEHYDLMQCASLNLNANPSDRALPNNELLIKQRSSDILNKALMERVYNQAIYTVACSSGYSMTRLSGMWTGEWVPGWRSEYTMDANVNLQTSGMNTANTKEFGIGYIKFILRQIDDWIVNAKRCYDIDNAIMAPVNCDGDGALGAEYCQEYPFQYWNAGASWMLQPIYEFYQCFGNVTIVDDNDDEKELLKDILLPLLTLQSNFWAQLVTPEYYTDSNGNACYEKGKTTLAPDEKYLIIPSYSPENMTGGDEYNSTLAVNAAIDISAAKSGIEMTIDVENLTKTDDYEKRVEYWQKLLDKLPDYQYDEGGAIKEWCANKYLDNNKHRHISHLYCAWPMMETQHDADLTNACLRALDIREKENSASHGFVHQALVFARLKQGERVYSLLHDLLNSDICYESLMTDHNTNRISDTYCTDTELGLIGIINEALLYSNDGEIELLPALPSDWTSGEINDLMARTRAKVSIKWDEHKAVAAITSEIDQTLRVSCAGSDARIIDLSAGKETTIEFNL